MQATYAIEADVPGKKTKKRKPCNGWNHGPDCQCEFRGGHRNSRIPYGWGWKALAVRGYKKAVRVRCEQCGKFVYRIPGAFPNQLAFDEFGPPWPQHTCVAKVKRRSKPPSSKIRKSNENAEVIWSPFQIVKLSSQEGKTAIVGVWHLKPRRLCLFIAAAFLPARHLPTYIRRLDRQTGSYQLCFFGQGAIKPSIVTAQNDAPELFR